MFPCHVCAEREREVISMAILTGPVMTSLYSESKRVISSLYIGDLLKDGRAGEAPTSYKLILWLARRSLVHGGDPCVCLVQGSHHSSHVSDLSLKVTDWQHVIAAQIYRYIDVILMCKLFHIFNRGSSHSPSINTSLLHETICGL